VAMEKGFTQVLWLDAVERKYIEEVGTSNVFFLIGDELITPPLGGSILPGVTRDSVIQIARNWNIRVSERPISIDELLDSSANGSLKEAFASGTAAIVSPIGKISYKDRAIIINNEETGALTKKLYNEILQIQYGEKDDPFNWRMPISG
jgi:branched-chain amino acid aminotransferase